MYRPCDASLRKNENFLFDRRENHLKTHRRFTTKKIHALLKRGLVYFL